MKFAQLFPFFLFLFLSFYAVERLKVPEGLSNHVASSRKAQANWYRKLLVAWRESNPPPRTPEEASRLVVQTLKGHRKADVEGLLGFYGLPLPHALVETTAEVPVALPPGVVYEFHTLPHSIDKLQRAAELLRHSTGSYKSNISIISYKHNNYKMFLPVSYRPPIVGAAHNLASLKHH
ncbi:hypothetical protein EUGRSUZ_J00158 [Eucalyptus grandis]|uniref:Uncharacterized protein n=2 Tax=Eucalyptus grandis TaxID=71139 RepID=A0ACC3J0Q2_EUCGR|nr:hypothetical protein EUGRSUZ_J00158 [Eucalyptus grandis]